MHLSDAGASEDWDVSPKTFTTKCLDYKKLKVLISSVFFLLSLFLLVHVSAHEIVYIILEYSRQISSKNECLSHPDFDF